MSTGRDQGFVELVAPPPDQQNLYTFNNKLFTLDTLAELLGALDYLYAKLEEQI